MSVILLAAETADMTSTPDPTHHNFGLTEQEFSRLQETLRLGDEQLFEQVFLAHFERCLSFLQSKYKAEYANAYDTTMWSMLRFRQMLAEGKLNYGNLEAYLLRIAVTKYLKDQHSNKEIAMEQLPELQLHQEDVADEETLALLAHAWAKLGALCQQLLKGVYYDGTDLKTMTVILGDSSEANTRKRKERCIKELRKYFLALE